jgi:hypothetical protein
MTQYDLLLQQNISVAGTEFSERLVNIAKGGILSALANGTPSVLAGGADGYHLVRDDAEVTGLKWVAVSGGHTQNTDTGTTSSTFTVDSDGVVGKIILSAANVAANWTTTIKNQAQSADIDITLPAITGVLATETYAQNLFASNDAMVYKGTVGTGGTIEKAALEALTTYNAGWTYRVITTGVYFGVTLEVGDLITAIVDRTGSGDVDADWTMIQTNLDGAVIGPASVAGGELVVFNGTTGKLIAAGSGAPGTMAYETATDYVAKTLFDATTLLFATSDNTPVALLGTELPPKLWAEVPTDKIGTGWTGTAVAGQIARDANYVYLCVTGGTATNQAWIRWAAATNWVN